MGSQPRTREREEDRRLDIRTLVIASAASAVAAVIVSRFWVAGTWMAAALTPVIVTIVSELLRRPTERISERFTGERSALPPQTVREAPPRPARRPPPATRPAAPPPEPDAPVRVYKAARSRRRIALITAGLAFVIAVAAISVVEVVADDPLGKEGRDPIFFGSTKKDRDQPQQQQDEPAAPQPAEPEQQRTTETQPRTEPRTQPTQPPPTTPPQTTPGPRTTPGPGTTPP